MHHPSLAEETVTEKERRGGEKERDAGDAATTRQTRKSEEHREVVSVDIISNHKVI